MNKNYIEDCKENAIKKKALELEILHSKSVSLPIESSNFENYVYFSTSPGSLESYEIVMEWIREVRTGLNPYNILKNKISSHEGFVALHSLNNLRRNKIPNFLYYHGIAEIKDKDESTFYALSEDLFSDKDDEIFIKSFKDVCENENWNVVLSYYISILLSLMNANRDVFYANYDLNLNNIMMKYMSNSIFDVEYDFEDFSVWVHNYGYIPTITRFDKSYIKIYADGILKSFGYNKISEIPFENKGIFCDRGFVISDAYTLLLDILEFTQDKNVMVYEKLKVLLKFFTTEEPKTLFGIKHFLPYFSKTCDLSLENYIKYIISIYNEILTVKPKNDILRCIGSRLEIKSASVAYYTPSNTIQLYDFIKYYSSYINEYNTDIVSSFIEKGVDYYNKFYEKDNFKRDIERHDKIINFVKIHSSLVKFTEDNIILDNLRYISIIKNYINACIQYYNYWERLKTGQKILNYLEDNSESFKIMLESYNLESENNKSYYELMYANLIEIRSIFRKNMKLYNDCKNEILFLETLE